MPGEGVGVPDVGVYCTGEKYILQFMYVCLLCSVRGCLLCIYCFGLYLVITGLLQSDPESFIVYGSMDNTGSNFKVDSHFTSMVSHL